MSRAIGLWLCLISFLLGSPVLVQGGEEVGTPDALLAVDAPGPHPIVGERLDFQGRWFGIPVGYGSFEVKEIVAIEGRQAYHIEVQMHSNTLLSKFYPIRDIVHSYLDVETLKPLRFEKDQREGHYRAHEIVTFDHTRRLATYRSLLNESVKEIPLPDTFQDLLTALYWFRRQPLTGEPLTVNLYTDEKIYQTGLVVQAPAVLELLKRGTFPCVTVEPMAHFKGLLVKRSRLWAYFTIDAHRLPLLVQVATPWGPMSAVLDEASIPETARRKSVSPHTNIGHRIE